MSKFTSVLKNIGLIAAQAAGNYFGVGDIIKNVVKTPAPPPGIIKTKLQDLWDVIKKAELIVGILKGTEGTGADRLKLAAPEIAGMVLEIDDFKGRKPSDEVEFKAGVDDLAAALVRIGNSYEKK